MVKLRLPPLSTLRAFEAAGRHLSFKAAAEEVHVTPSAISHSIQSLEDWLGVSLFTRGKRGLGLTAAGRAYFPTVQEALTLLARASATLPGRAPKGTLSISVAPTFASRWLVPRLPKFRRQHPDIAVSLDTSLLQVDFPLDGIDLAIRMGTGPFPRLYAQKLVTEQLVPVCSPGFASSIDPPLRHPADLGRATLIHVTMASEDWAAWCAAAGVADIDLDRGMRCDTIQLAIDATVQGLGVAIGRRPLIDEDLAAGRLVPLFDPAVESKTAYWLVGPKETMSQPEALAFRNWLLSELTAGDACTASAG